MKMIKRIIAPIGIAGLALASLASGHYTLKHFEANNVNNIPRLTAQAQQTRNDLARYRDEGIITPTEDRELYDAFGSFRDSLSDYFGLISKESLDLRRNFQYMKHLNLSGGMVVKGRTVVAGKEFSYSDWEKIDNILKQYQQYLQTDEYKELVGSQSPDERLRRLLVSFLDS